jgi:predicted nuclease of predicted toxin-antitoxin system
MSPAAGVELRAEEHDVIWAGDWPVDPGDDEVLRRAHAEGRVLITLDKDFGELAVALRRPHAGIVRLVGFRAAEPARACAPVLGRFAAELANGAIVTSSPDRLRIRPGSE